MASILACLAAANAGFAGPVPDRSPKGSTAFCLTGGKGPVFGKNHDFDIEIGLLVVNTRGSAKKGFNVDRPANWLAKHGSVTFTQYSRDFAWGGMNEAGLVIEMLGITRKNAMQYPAADVRPAIRQGQWVQYQLDTASSVDEVVASDKLIRIENKPQVVLTSHYLVCDAQGGCAVVEFIGGRLVAYRGQDLVARALTNTTYDELADGLRQYDQKPKPLPSAEDLAALSPDDQSSARFLRAATMTRAYKEAEHGPAAEYALRILETLRGPNTKWRIVYDVPTRRVRWSTASAPAEKNLEFATLDFSKDTPVLCMDVQSKAAGNVRESLVTWTHDLNTTLIRAASTALLAIVPQTGIFMRNRVQMAADEGIRLTIEHITATCPPQKAQDPPGKTTGGAAHPVSPPGTASP